MLFKHLVARWILNVVGGKSYMIKLLTAPWMNLARGNLWSGVAASSPPETPTSFDAAAGNQEITLTWDAQPEADNFEIYYATLDNFGIAAVLTSVATGTGFTYDSDAGIQSGEKYYFWVCAINGAGASAFSSSVTARSYVTLANSGSVTLQVPSPGLMDLNDLLFRTGGTFPTGINVYWVSELYYTTGAGTWEDGINGGVVNPAIFGGFTVENTTGSSITFWDTEP